MASFRLAILDDYQRIAQTCADWSPVLHAQVQIDVFDDTLLDENALAERLKPYDIICTMRERTKITASLLEKLPNLKLITTTMMRNRAIDIDAATSKGIPVSGTTGVNSTFEHIWALIFAVTRHIVAEDANVKAGYPQWQSKIPTGLSGKTMGLLGLGSYGTKVANVAKIFDMKVLAWSPNLTQERADEAGVEFARSKTDLFKRADILSIHMVLAPSTRHLVTAADLAHLKPTAFLINTSRGPIVEENALVDMLSNNRIAGAGLDVYDIEPLPLDHPIRKLQNVTLSPHNAYVNDDCYKEWWGQTVENITNFLDGKPSRLLK